MESIVQILARELEKAPEHVENVIRLIDEGNTIPFIARYRKELHGSMDDTALRTLSDRLQYLRNLQQRREEVKGSIEGQGKLTEELAAAIDAAATLAEKGVTEIYMVAYTNPRPYNTATGQTLAEAIQGYWDKVGVKCTIDAYDWTTYIDKCNTGDFDVCLFGWTGDNGDPDNFLNLLANEDIGINVAHYDDEEYKSMLAEAVSLPNGDERNALYAEMEQKLADECIWRPISHQENLSAYLSNVQNFIYHPTGSVYLSHTYKN